MRTRRGFTLIELLVVLVLLSFVLGGIYRLLNNTQRVARAQAEHVDMQSNMRAGTLIVPSELQAIGYDSIPGVGVVPDLTSLDANSVIFRAYRSLGTICQVIAPNQLMVSRLSDLRDPDPARDSLMFFVEGNATSTLDDRWVSRGFTAVTATACPDGTAAWLYTTTFAVTSPPAPSNDPVAVTDITPGSPLRTFEVMEYSLYQDGAPYYLGARSVSTVGATRQPVLGPLWNNGFHLEYYDSAGTAIPTPTAALADRRKVRAIQVTLIGASAQNVTSSGYGIQRQAVDSVVTLVQLRNAVHR